MNAYETGLGRDMQRVGLVAYVIALLVVAFAFNAAQPWSVIGGFCAGFLAVFGTCYWVVGLRTIREARDGKQGS